MTQAPKGRNVNAPSADEILDWLRRNPDFVAECPELLDRIAAPQRDLGDGVADLQHAMIGKLRADLDVAQEHQRELIAAGRANLASQSRVHDCMLAMLSANSFEQLIQTVTTDFAVLLDLDLVTLCIETDGSGLPPPDTRGMQVVPAGTVSRLIGDGRTVLLRDGVEGEAEVYGGGAPLIASDALARLTIAPSTPPGLIAFGSREPGRFQPGQAVELLAFLAQSLERTIGLWLFRP